MANVDLVASAPQPSALLRQKPNPSFNNIAVVMVVVVVVVVVVVGIIYAGYHLADDLSVVRDARA